MKIYEIYANDELWDETSCPFGTEVLNREGYDINMGELYGLEEELTTANIEFVQSGKHLMWRCHGKMRTNQVIF